MKLRYIFLTFLILTSVHANAFTKLTVPERFTIQSNWSAPTYTIYTKGKNIYNIYSYAPTSLSTYEMYDATNNFVISGDLRLGTDPIRVQFYEGQSFLGFIDQTSKNNKFRSFYIYASDGKTRLIKGELNYWGTNIILSRVSDRKEFAKMSSAYYCKWCTWQFEMTNRDIFNEIPILPQVVFLSLGLQGEGWHSYKSPSNSSEDDDAPDNPDNSFRDLIDLTSLCSGNASPSKPKEIEIKKVIDGLDNGFKKYSQGKRYKNSFEKVRAYEDYCLTIISSSRISDDTRKTILYLVNNKIDRS